MTDSALLLNQNTQEEISHLSSKNSEQQTDLHLFKDVVSNTKNLTLNLYSKFNFRSTVLEQNFEKLNNKSEPYVEKVTSFLDCGLNKVAKTISPITSTVVSAQNKLAEKTKESKQKVVDLVGYVTDSGKQTQIFKKAEKLTVEILNHIEKDVSQLENKVNGVKKSKKSAALQLAELKSDDGSQAPIEQLNIGVRVKNLTKKINRVSKSMADSSLQFMSASSPVQKIKKAYSFAAVPVRESLIFSKVLRDYMLENFMVPVYKVATLQLTEGAQFVKLSVSAPKQTFLETVWPSIVGVCDHVKKSTIHVSSSSVKFMFDVAYFKENSSKIIEEIQHVQESVMKSHIVAQQKAIETYTNAIQEYQSRREKYISNSDNAIEMVPYERSNQKSQTTRNLEDDIEALDNSHLSASSAANNFSNQSHHADTASSNNDKENNPNPEFSDL